MEHPRRRRGVRLPSITLEHLWVLIVLTGIVVFVNTHPIRPHDFWWHMAAGREIAKTGRIPTVDTFSRTMAGAPIATAPAAAEAWRNLRLEIVLEMRVGVGPVFGMAAGSFPVSEIAAYFAGDSLTGAGGRRQTPAAQAGRRAAPPRIVTPSVWILHTGAAVLAVFAQFALARVLHL